MPLKFASVPMFKGHAEPLRRQWFQGVQVYKPAKVLNHVIKEMKFFMVQSLVS